MGRRTIVKVQGFGVGPLRASGFVGIARCFWIGVDAARATDVAQVRVVFAAAYEGTAARRVNAEGSALKPMAEHPTDSQRAKA